MSWSLPCKIVVVSKTNRRKYGPTKCWESFVELQPEWIQLFLEEVHLYTDNGHQNIDEILTLHDQLGHLLSVSEGSVIFYNMPFGWVIATPDGRRLAAGCSPCEGRGNSLCSEGAGMMISIKEIGVTSSYKNQLIRAYTEPTYI
jgi:hypothetical protein